MRLALFCAAAIAFAPMAASAQNAGVSGSYYLEDLTWPEVAARMTTGTNTIIIPTGGTEQNGPAIAIGKHNWIVHFTSGEIARQLGTALAAPVLAYVPEGSVNPPQGHMLFPGTISVSDQAFAGILEDTARSFKQHGFKYIFFLGDSGGNQDAQKAVAARLTKEWANDHVVVANLDAYYADAEGAAYAKGVKLGGDDPQAHAGFMDASESMAAHAGSVRMDKVMHYAAKDAATTGAVGDPEGATVEHGKALLALKVKTAVAEIRRITGAK